MPTIGAPAHRGRAHSRGLLCPRAIDRSPTAPCESPGGDGARPEADQRRHRVVPRDVGQDGRGALARAAGQARRGSPRGRPQAPAQAAAALPRPGAWALTWGGTDSGAQRKLQMHVRSGPWAWPVLLVLTNQASFPCCRTCAGPQLGGRSAGAPRALSSPASCLPRGKIFSGWRPNPSSFAIDQLPRMRRFASPSRCWPAGGRLRPRWSASRREEEGFICIDLARSRSIIARSCNRPHTPLSRFCPKPQILEKQTKTKAFSKVGLAKVTPEDPAEAAKAAAVEWLQARADRHRSIGPKPEFEGPKPDRPSPPNNPPPCPLTPPQAGLYRGDGRAAGRNGW